MSRLVEKESILALFYTTEQEHHLREIARKCDMNPATAKKYLERYEQEGLLESTTERGNLIYKPSHTERYKLKKRNWNVERMHTSGLVNQLQQELSYPTIILFGSYAHGENTPRSDLDLFIITDEKKELNLEKYESMFGEIQVFQHTRKEFGELRKNSKELINNVINGITLTGFLEAV